MRQKELLEKILIEIHSIKVAVEQALLPEAAPLLTVEKPNGYQKYPTIQWQRRFPEYDAKITRLRKEGCTARQIANVIYPQMKEYIGGMPIEPFIHSIENRLTKKATEQKRI